MIYPNRIVPNKHQIKIKKPDPKHHLCRWVNPECELKDHEGKLNTEAIETKRIFDLSTNKIPYSKIEDVYIRITDNTYEESWNEGKEGLVVPEDKFIYEKDRKFFILKVADIINEEGKYPFPGDAESFDYKFVIRIKHNPLVSNYYHCTLFFDLFDSESNAINEPKRKSTSRKILEYEIRQVLIKHAKFEI